MAFGFPSGIGVYLHSNYFLGELTSYSFDIQMECQTRFIIMGNMFYSKYGIHRRFDLKGSSYGRSTDKPEGQVDETTTLKDLDLNFIFHLQKSRFEELIRCIYN